MCDYRNLTIDKVKPGLASRSILLVDVYEPNEFALALHPYGAIDPIANPLGIAF
jgi:hypothetical protein